MILKVRFENGHEVNTDLGREYHRIDKDICPEGYKECADKEFGENLKNYVDECYCFIVHDKGSKTIPLYLGQENVILHDSGVVFKDMTHR